MFTLFFASDFDILLMMLELIVELTFHLLNMWHAY